jgi:hypothetical protein
MKNLWWGRPNRHGIMNGSLPPDNEEKAKQAMESSPDNFGCNLESIAFHEKQAFRDINANGTYDSASSPMLMGMKRGDWKRMVEAAL